MEMIRRDFQGTPQEFMQIWFKENKKNAKKHIHKEN